MIGRPRSFHKACVQGTTTSRAAHHLVNQFPMFHYNTFIYLMCFIKELKSIYVGQGGLNDLLLSR